MPGTPVRVVRADVIDTPLDTDALVAEVNDDRCGAVASFFGVIRNHDGGHDVTGIEYSHHPSANRVIAEIAAGFTGRDGVHAISVVHRVGTLTVGDVALVAVVAAEHRGQAFAAVSDLVDAIKAGLPIWKRQELTDGGHEWTNLP